MEEYESLIGILRKQNHSIPRTALFWYFFKRHVLEKDHVRQHFDQSEFDRQQYKQQLCCYANPQSFGPQFCRLKNPGSRRRNINELVRVTYYFYEVLLAKSSPIQVKHSPVSNGGLGLFLKSDMICKNESKLLELYLYGLLLRITKEDFDWLSATGHHSLMASGRYKYLFVGPLSLVNHECNSLLGFSKQTRSAGALSDYFAEVPVTQVFVKQKCTLAAGMEILVDYFDEPPATKPADVFGNVCRCSFCVVVL